MTRGTGRYYVGLEIDRDRQKKIIQISQSTYINKLLERFHMLNAHGDSVPADPGVVLQSSDGDSIKFPYRECVGSLMFAAIATRPDISYAVGEVSRFLQNPSAEHVEAVKRILRYLKDNPDLGLVYGDVLTNNWLTTELNLEGYTDANYARDLDTR